MQRYRASEYIETTGEMKSMNDREAIENLYRTYWQCMIKIDIAGMDRIMVENYELRHMTGLRQSKQDFFDSVRSGTHGVCRVTSHSGKKTGPGS